MPAETPFRMSDLVTVNVDLEAVVASNARNIGRWRSRGYDSLMRTYQQYGLGGLSPWAGSVTDVLDEAPTRPLKPVDAPSRMSLERVSIEAIALDGPRAALAIEAEDLLGYSALRFDVKAPSPLHRALAKLEIDVLDEESVDKYKTQMVEHYRSYNKLADPTWRLTRLSDYALPVPEFVLAKAVSIKRELPNAEFYIDQLAVDPFLIVSLEDSDDDSVYDSRTNQTSRALDSDSQAYIEVWDEPKFEATL